MPLALPLVLSTFGLIFVAELPDKTALAALALSTRYPLRQVVPGVWLAFLLQTLVAIAAGSLLQLLPAQPVRMASGMGFFVFAYLAFRRTDDSNEDAPSQTDFAKPTRWRALPPWAASFLVVFAAEWGDLSQLATAALVAQTHDALSVGLGSVAALWLVTLVAAGTGSQVSRVLTPRRHNLLSAILFATVGLVVTITTLLGV